jgi:hypothetical protein
MSERAYLRQILKNQLVIMDAVLAIAKAPGVTSRTFDSPLANRKSETRQLLGEISDHPLNTTGG